MFKRKALLPLYLSLIVEVVTISTWFASDYFTLPDLLVYLIKYATIIHPIFISIAIINILVCFFREKTMRCLSLIFLLLRPSSRKLVCFIALIITSVLVGGLFSNFTERVPGDFLLFLLNFLAAELYLFVSYKSIDFTNVYTFTTLLLCLLKWTVFYGGLSILFQFKKEKVASNE